MKKSILIILCLGLLFGISSCVVINKKDNGKHKGWYKSPDNKSNNSNKSKSSSKSSQGNSSSSKKK